MEISAEVLRLVLYGRLQRDVDDLLRRRQKCQAQCAGAGPVCILPSSLPGVPWGVFCTSLIKQGTEMGPYTGTTSWFYPHVTFSPTAWELLNTDGHLAAYIDGGSRPSNWLAYVQCARSDAEQNLEIDQIGNQIYYRATKDIRRGDELLVWYGKSYGLYMGVPCLKQSDGAQLDTKVPIAENKTEGEDKPSANSQGLSPTKWRCVLCQRAFNSRSNLRSHMRIHTLEKPFSCKYCGRKFSQSSTLRNHVRLHTGEKPYKCLVCKSSYSQLAGLRAHQRSSTHKPGGTSSVKKYNSVKCGGKYNSVKYADTHGSVKCDDNYNSVKCNDNYNSVKCNDNYNRVKCNEKYNSVKCNDKYISVKCNDKYDSAKCSAEYTSVNCDEKYNSVKCKDLDHRVKFNDKYNIVSILAKTHA